jgi:hypothetical protein
MSSETTSRTEHTPGPWAWDHARYKMRGDGDCLVLSGGPLVGKKSEANAHLIAAAPDLLAACEKVYLELDSLTGGEPDHPLSNYVGNWKAELRAAVTRAKGGAA